MARTINKLTPLAISKANKAGLYGDGGGLYLQIGPTGAKSWLFRFMLKGKAREMGLGPLHTVNVAEARAKSIACRTLLLAGKDPIEERNAAIRQDEAQAKTFRQCAEAYIEAHRAGWKNAKHASQWENTLRDYAYPTIGDLPVGSIDTDLVLKCLSGIWTEKTETASRVRGRIESVLDWATSRKYRTGENPARWRGHLDTLLASPKKVAKVEHHPALPYDQIGAFIASLQEQSGIAARALEFAILTATRTNEVIGATWGEFDLDKGLWTIPSARMKAEKEHRIPLSAHAMAILSEMQQLGNHGYVFPGMKEKKPLSNMAMLVTLRRMKRNDLTVHGFRSTFRDWAGETTAYPREVIEHALAHQLKDKAEAAYARGTLFEKRQRLMADWANYCTMTQTGANVTPIKRKKA
jgi:integrase